MKSRPLFEWASPSDLGPSLAVYLRTARTADRDPALRCPDRAAVRSAREWAVELLAAVADDRVVPDLCKLALDRRETLSSRALCLSKGVELGATFTRQEIDRLFRLPMGRDLWALPDVVVSAARAGQPERAIDFLHSLTAKQRANCLVRLTDCAAPEATPYLDWLYDRWLNTDRAELEGVPWIQGDSDGTPINGVVAFATCESAPSRNLLGQLLPQGPVGWATYFLDEMYREKPSELIRLACALDWTDALTQELKLPAEALRGLLGEDCYRSALRRALEPFLELGWGGMASPAYRRCIEAWRLLEREVPECVAEVLVPLLSSAYEHGDGRFLVRTLVRRAPDAALYLAHRGARATAAEWLTGYILHTLCRENRSVPLWLIQWGEGQRDATAQITALVSALRSDEPGVAKDLARHEPEHDRDQGVRLARHALRMRLGDERSKTNLIDAARSADRAWRAAAVALIGEMNDPAYLGFLSDYLSGEEGIYKVNVADSVTRTASAYLARLGTPAAMTVLIRFALTPYDCPVQWAVRRDVEEWLVKQGLASEFPRLEPAVILQASSPDELLGKLSWSR